jgi:hypothetical protein
MLDLLSLRILTKVDLALDSARIIRHMLETMRVWISFLIFLEVRAEDDGGFSEKIGRGCEEGLYIFRKRDCGIFVGTFWDWIDMIMIFILDCN